MLLILLFALKFVLLVSTGLFIGVLCQELKTEFKIFIRADFLLKFKAKEPQMCTTCGQEEATLNYVKLSPLTDKFQLWWGCLFLGWFLGCSIFVSVTSSCTPEQSFQSALCLVICLKDPLDIDTVNKCETINTSK